MVIRGLSEAMGSWKIICISVTEGYFLLSCLDKCEGDNNAAQGDNRGRTGFRAGRFHSGTGNKSVGAAARRDGADISTICPKYITPILSEKYFTTDRSWAINNIVSPISSRSCRIGVMYFGHMVEMAESEELFAHPIHGYTKALLLSVPCHNRESPIITAPHIAAMIRGICFISPFPSRGADYRLREFD